MANPKWWNEEHESTWSRVKAAMKRDWEQTKADVSSKGHDMDQDVDDTIKQAAGKQPIPPVGARTIEDEDFERDEEAYRLWRRRASPLRDRVPRMGRPRRGQDARGVERPQVGPHLGRGEGRGASRLGSRHQVVHAGRASARFSVACSAVDATADPT